MQAGFFVLNWGTAPESCKRCDPTLHTCDEDHQRLPKPSGPGIWIDPEDGNTVQCNPVAACLWYKTVEGVLSGGCSEGYEVRATLMGLSCVLAAASFRFWVPFSRRNRNVTCRGGGAWTAPRRSTVLPMGFATPAMATPGYSTSSASWLRCLSLQQSSASRNLTDS